MGSEICLVLHRKSANEPAIKEAVKHVRGQGIDLDVRIPWNKKAKPRVVKEAIARGAKRVIAGGGDGTINAVVNALVGKGKKTPKATLGVLPLGTANDFAHGLGLPCDDLKQCLEIACTAEAKPIDVGRANKRSFINVTSGGFGAEITATTPQEMKKLLGGLAYTLMGLAKAMGAALFADKISARQADEWGLIWEAIADDAAYPGTLAIRHPQQCGGPRRPGRSQGRVLERPPRAGHAEHGPQP